MKCACVHAQSMGVCESGRSPSPAHRGARAWTFCAQEMLRRKPTRIELKPDDRDEYFDHKNKTKPDSSNKDDKYSKDVRIGLKTPR